MKSAIWATSSGVMSNRKGKSFGVVRAHGRRYFRVYVPDDTALQVSVCEHYNTEDLGWVDDDRACITRDRWERISGTASKVFNTQLVADKRARGSFTKGANFLDGNIGRELCVLVWAAEHVPVSGVAAVARNWAELKVNDRWWLYKKALAFGGWRTALRYALG